jgi:hypothetical protein
LYCNAGASCSRLPVLATQSGIDGFGLAVGLLKETQGFANQYMVKLDYSMFPPAIGSGDIPSAGRRLLATGDTTRQVIHSGAYTFYLTFSTDGMNNTNVTTSVEQTYANFIDTIPKGVTIPVILSLAAVMLSMPIWMTAIMKLTGAFKYVQVYPNDINS